MRAKGDIGETLVEILLTVVIIGLTITALISSLATVSNAGNAQRNSVQADVVMRNYAEATKAAVQGCVVGGTYTATYSAPGFVLSVDPPGNTCPSSTTPKLLKLIVVGPTGLRQTMQIKVSTP